MSERDFDIYLSLLARMLRLSAGQRAAIEDELRDHLAERLDEFLGRGMTREEAVRAALEEFGDAAGLAQRFTSIATLHRRRLIMRYSFASLAALAVGATVVLSILPERNDVPVQGVAVAEQPPVPAAEVPRSLRPSVSEATAQATQQLEKFINDI